MELVINSRGAHISKVDERFQVTIDGVNQCYTNSQCKLNYAPL